MMQPCGFSPSEREQVPSLSTLPAVTHLLRRFGVGDLFKCWLGACVALSLVGCSKPIVKEGDAPAGPAYVKWIPQTYAESAETIKLPPVPEKWWSSFGSAELDGFVENAFKNNYDLKAAIARVAQSGAQADAVRALQSPTIDGVAGYQNQGPWNGVATAPTTEAWSTREVYQGGLRVNYEVDLWGKLGFNTESAYQKSVVSQYARDSVALLLAADVVSTYFSVVSLTERLAVGTRNLNSISKVRQGIERRVARGDSTVIDLSQQIILEKNTQANLSLLNGQRVRELNRLAQLQGLVPGSLKVQAASIEVFKRVDLSAGLPSELLCRRPDIKAAEASLLSAQADLYAARASLLPAFSLSGQTGMGSYYLSTILSPQSFFFNITSNLLQNIFDGGRRDADIRATRARNFEVLEAYASTVQAALRDVEDALNGLETTKLRYQSLAISRDQAQKLAANTRKLLERGAIDFVQLLTIEQTVLASEDSIISARRDQLKAAVDLYKSLGGGAADKEDRCLKEGRRG
jgi:NodT family efflux transporter outer membrane factor (OMF) lipoprotein